MADPRSRSPFPGMDPCLEQYWGDVHHALCTYSRDLLRRGLPPGLIARIDERTIIEDESGEERTIIPDVPVVERGGGGVALAAPPIAVAEPLVIEIANEPIERLPAMRVPLRPNDPDAVLDLQALIDQVYENGSYGYDVDYTEPPRPPLLPTDARWADAKLKDHAKDPS